MAIINSGLEFDKEEHHKKMKARMKNMDTSQFPLRIPNDLYKKVKMKLIKEDTKLQRVLIEFLEQYVMK